MTYYESAEGIVCTHKRALEELKEHGMLNAGALEEFYEDLGKRDHYDAQEVLQWLGY